MRRLILATALSVAFALPTAGIQKHLNGLAKAIF